jgi:hypothetical protein
MNAPRGGFICRALLFAVLAVAGCGSKTPTDPDVVAPDDPSLTLVRASSDSGSP